MLSVTVSYVFALRPGVYSTVYGSPAARWPARLARRGLLRHDLQCRICCILIRVLRYLSRRMWMNGRLSPHDTGHSVPHSPMVHPHDHARRMARSARLWGLGSVEKCSFLIPALYKTSYDRKSSIADVPRLRQSGLKSARRA